MEQMEPAVTGAEEEDCWPAFKTVAKDPEGAFTLATAEAEAEGEEQLMPACKTVAKDPEGSFTLATAEAGDEGDGDSCGDAEAESINRLAAGSTRR